MAINRTRNATSTGRFSVVQPGRLTKRSGPRSTARDTKPPGGTAGLEVHLLSIPSGVAAGRTRAGRGNSRTEWWTLFGTREQFDACLDTDPLRFAAPLLHAQLKREFDHVIQRTGAAQLHPGAFED